MSSAPGMSSVGPPPVPEKSSKRGCIIAVVVVLLLLVGGCVGFFWWSAKNAGKLMAMGVEAIKKGAPEMIASDVPPELRDELNRQLDAYADRMRQFNPAAAASGTDPNALMAPMQQLQLAMGDKQLTTDEIQRFVDAVKALEASAPRP